MRYFETEFLEDADAFIAQLNPKTIKKILYHIDLAEQTNNPKLFKKLNDDLWEFRTKSLKLHIRLLAFWDKTANTSTLVIVTHGFIKKTDKVPIHEIDRALTLKKNYIQNKK